MSKPLFSDRIPPQNIDAERAVLGAMLLNPDAIDKGIEILGESVEPMYLEAHKLVFGAILALQRDGKPIDMVTLTDRMTSDGTLERAGGVTYIAEFTDAVPTSANIEHYAEIVREMWQRRAAITVCSQAAGDLYKLGSKMEDVLGAVDSGLFAIATGRSQNKAVSIDETLPGQEDILRRLIAGEEPQGIRTGFASLDRLQRPLQAGEYIIIAARPSVGKTTFACNVALEVMRKYAVPVLILSMEMSKEAIAQKFISIAGGLDIMMVEQGKAMTAVAEGQLRRGLDELARLPLYIDDEPNITALALRTKVRQAVKEHAIGLVVIDYIQLMDAPGTDSRNEAVGEISRQIKAAARETGIPFIVLSQLNREGVDKPRLSHLRESGSLEQDCDVAWLLSKSIDAENPDAVCLEVAKQRVGATGDIQLFFRKEVQRFSCMDYDEPPAEFESHDISAPFDEFVVDNIENEYSEEEDGVLF